MPGVIPSALLIKKACFLHEVPKIPVSVPVKLAFADEIPNVCGSILDFPGIRELASVLAN
jgi:hypothetical protein